MFYPPNHRRLESRAGEISRDFGWTKTWFRFARDTTAEAVPVSRFARETAGESLSLSFDARLSRPWLRIVRLWRDQRRRTYD